MSRSWAARFVMIVLSLQASPHAQTAASPAIPAVRQIEITSHLSKLGARRTAKEPRGSGISDPDATDLVIYKKGNAYYLDDKEVDGNLIAALLKALSAPTISEVNAEDLGVTPAWLKAHAPSVAQHFTDTRINGEPIHREALESAFADSSVMDTVVPILFDNRHYFCADCVRLVTSVKISVSFEDGTSLEARSSSKFPYMLPWLVRSSGEAVKAYNADISRATAGLMPEKSTNRSRLSGEQLDVALGGVVLMREERESRLLDLEKETGGTLSAIRSRYTVGSANIDKYGEAGMFGAGAGESNLRLHLTASGWPADFSDEVTLEYVNGSVVGTDKFLSDGARFEKLVLSVPWLRRYAENHPKVPIGLTFVHDTSLSDAALQLFSADMKAIGSGKLVPKVEAAKDQIALLTIGSGMGHSQWLVFPDLHMVLWRYWQIGQYGGPPDLAPWSANSAKPCAEPKSFIRCVGREVSPTGGLQSLE